MPTVEHDPANYRFIESHLKVILRHMCLSENAKEELNRWLKKLIRRYCPDKELFTDASGVGVHIRSLNIMGVVGHQMNIGILMC